MSAGLLQARFGSSLTQMVSAPVGKFRLTRNLATGCCVGRLKQYCGGSIGLSFSSTLSVKGEAMPEPLPRIRKVENEHQNGSSTVSDSISDAFQFLRVKKLSCNAVIPSRASPLAAGYDLSSAAACVVPARGKAMLPTDLSIAIPEGTYARVAPRSGLTWKHSIDVGAGVIDADYRGPVAVILFNHSDQDFQVNAGDRIAQLIIEKISTPEVLEVDDLDSTARGKGGFGSTGSMTILCKEVINMISIHYGRLIPSPSHTGIFLKEMLHPANHRD